MVTTTGLAFGPKSCARIQPKKMLPCNLILEGDRSFITTHREAFQSQPLDGAELKRTASLKEVRAAKAQTPHFQTHYQKYFAPQQGIYTRRFQVLPCPDNLAVNPALRSEFRTVQMEAYPAWNITVHSRPIPHPFKQQLSLKEEVIGPSATTPRKASSFISPVSF
ncbi:uncharacterized protein si:dkeyp-69c1.9 [Hoplias malabaricus]|uniref:uncharacterized protein si:dkeyp-69c1.9 n=1 Tax=Hoplias malabaricus TaxID=27720 RepID=UPI0034637BE1